MANIFTVQINEVWKTLLSSTQLIKYRFYNKKNLNYDIRGYTAALLNEFKAREFRLLQARQFYQWVSATKMCSCVVLT